MNKDISKPAGVSKAEQKALLELADKTATPQPLTRESSTTLTRFLEEHQRGARVNINSSGEVTVKG